MCVRACVVADPAPNCNGQQDRSSLTAQCTLKDPLVLAYHRRVELQVLRRPVVIYGDNVAFSAGLAGVRAKPHVGPHHARCHVCVCLFVWLCMHCAAACSLPASPRPALGSLGFRFLSALPTSAPGLDPSRPRCTGTGLAPCDICTGTGCKVLVPAHPVEPEGCSEATAGAEFSTTVGLFGFTSKPCRGAYPLAISIVRNAIAMGRPCHCHGLAIGLLLVAGIYLPLLWSSPHLCSAVPSCLLFNSYAKPCHASPHAAASGHALRVRRGGHMLAFARPRRHLLRSSHFSLLAVLIPDKETVAHAPNTRRLPLACSEGRQCPPLPIVR